MSELVLTLVAAACAWLALRGKFFHSFFVVLLTTEFFYIDVGGGIARLYHFFALVVIVALAKHVPRLISAPVFAALLAFVAVNILAASLSDSPGRAATSMIGFVANVGVALATGLILVAGRLDVGALRQLVLVLTLVSVAWGLVQILAIRTAGLNLALSIPQQVQIAIGFGPGFRTEANTFGKYMVFPLLFFLPDYIRQRRTWRHRFVASALLLGFVMNFTRSAFFGLVAALAFFGAGHTLRGRLPMLVVRMSGLFVLLGVGLLLLLGGFLGISEYALYKVANLLNQEELIAGESPAYRLMMMQAVIDRAFSSTKMLAIGNGWGQTHTYVSGVEVQAGGADFVNVLGYSGAVGLIAYVAYTFVALRAARRVTVSHRGRATGVFAEGVMLSTLGVFVTAQMAGYLIAPEYWMLIGFAGYLSTQRRDLRAAQPR